MNWEDLPLELRLLILSFRNKLRENEVIKIQRSFKRYIAPSKIVKDIVLDTLPVDDDAAVLCFDERSRKIIEFCTRVLSGKRDINFWNEILVCFEYGLILDKNIISSLNNDYQNNYYSTQKAYLILLERFNPSPKN